MCPQFKSGPRHQPVRARCWHERKWLRGRASPCQGEGRGFESRLPLHFGYFLLRNGPDWGRFRYFADQMPTKFTGPHHTRRYATRFNHVRECNLKRRPHNERNVDPSPISPSSRLSHAGPQRHKGIRYRPSRNENNVNASAPDDTSPDGRSGEAAVGAINSVVFIALDPSKSIRLHRTAQTVD